MDDSCDALQFALGRPDPTWFLPIACSPAWRRARVGLHQALRLRGCFCHIRSATSLWLILHGQLPGLGATWAGIFTFSLGDLLDRLTKRGIDTGTSLAT